MPRGLAKGEASFGRAMRKIAEAVDRSGHEVLTPGVEIGAAQSVIAGPAQPTITSAFTPTPTAAAGGAPATAPAAAPQPGAGVTTALAAARRMVNSAPTNGNGYQLATDGGTTAANGSSNHAPGESLPVHKAVSPTLAAWSAKKTR